MDSSSYTSQKFYIEAASSAAAAGLPEYFDPTDGLLDVGLLQDVCAIKYTGVAVCSGLHKRAEVIEINQRCIWFMSLSCEVPQ